MFSKVAKNVDTLVFTLKVMLFEMPKWFSKYLGYFCIKSCCREISKMAQSGHAAHDGPFKGCSFLFVAFIVDWDFATSYLHLDMPCKI